MKQFLRKYRLMIDTTSGGFDVSNFRCTFEIEKLLQEDPQYAEITVYNLSEEFNQLVIEKKTRAILEAGYEEGAYGLIYAGDILQAYRGRENGTDTYLKLICQDGDQFLNSSFIAQTLSAGAQSEDIIQSCATAGTVAITTGNISSDLSQQRLARGRVLFGSARDKLRQVSKGNQAQYYVDGGNLHVIKAMDTEKDTAFILTPSTGLIGTPIQNEDGISAECLLNAQIKLNSLVYIDPDLVQSATITADSKAQALSSGGIYRVIKINYSGDSHGDNWNINFDAVSQPGSIPSLLKNGATNPWR